LRIRLRSWWWLLLAPSFVFGLATLLTPRDQLRAIERDENTLYGATHPFAWRWAGVQQPKRKSPVDSKAEAERIAISLLALRPQLSSDPRWLRIAARLCLLTGRYSEAVAQYRRARLLGSHDIDGELAIALAMRAESEARPSDYGLALEYSARALRARPGDAVLRYNAAMLMEKTSLLRLAQAEWRDAIAAEHDTGWRAEATNRLEQLTTKLSLRAQALKRARNPETLNVAALAWPGALEAAQQAAIVNWMVRNPRHGGAERLLANEFERRHQDLWWRDFLAAPASAEALHLLSDSQRAYDSGRFADAETFGSAAEAAFERLGNPAGRWRARWQRIVSSHRGDDTSTCPALLNGFETEARNRSWQWLLAQYWLDEITCRNLLYLGSSLDDRERVLEKTEKIGFEGVTLRALAFLTEPQVAAGSPLRIWTRGFEGMSRFWTSLAPDYRLHHLAWCLSEVARMAEEPQTAVLLARESELNAGAEEDPGLRAEVLGDLALAESRAGLYVGSVAHFNEAARLASNAASGIPDKYMYDVEDDRAQADIVAGRPEAAIDSLNQAIGIEAGHRDPSDMGRARLVNTLGMALLRAKRYDEASMRFEESLAINRRILTLPKAQLERESLRHLYEAAFRGVTEARIRSGLRGAAALEVWNNYRGRPMSLPSKNAATLTFAVLPGGVSAWLMAGGSVDQRWVDVTRVREATQKLTGLAADPSAPFTAIQDAGRRTGELLLRSFEARLGSLREVDTLLIDPDDMLSRLPWGLVEFANGEKLVDRYSFAITQGYAGGSRPTPPLSSTSRVAIFADPHAEELGKEFPPLIDAVAEGRMVAGLFRSATVSEGAAATGEAFLKAAQQAEILHFAGHGITNGGFGGLVVAGNRPFLTAQRISQLPLSRLGLVVLSACSTGVAQETEAVNADTLVRGFLDAGAARVVASSWDVDSATTRELMSKFYAGVLAGQTPALALRKAMLSVARVPSTSHPSSWAAFELYGKP